MKRLSLRHLLLPLPALLFASLAGAQSDRAVVVYEPDSATCVQPKTLLSAIAAAGSYFPSVSPAGLQASPPLAPLFKITGEPNALRVRGWGLSAAKGEDAAPLGSPDSAADLDKTLSVQTCESAGNAVAETVVAALQEAAANHSESATAGTGSSQAVIRVLVDVQRQLGGKPALTASVQGDELGLSLVVADPEGSCRRGTWLQAAAEPGLRLGKTVPQLKEEVLACLQRPLLAPAVKEDASDRSSRRVDGIFHLPEHAGAAVAGLGVIVSAVAVAGADESSALLFGALPPLAGGIASYAVPENLRQPVILGGYWLGVAGASLVSASQDEASKSWLIGGALAGGALTSASMALLTGFRRGDEPSLPAWAVALPSTVGAAVAAGSLFTGTDGPRSVPLAALGTLAALIPNAWLFYRLEGNSADRTPRVGALAGASTAGLVVSGDF